MSAGDPRDAFGLDAEGGCHVGVADAVAFVECADDVLSAFAQCFLQVGHGFEYGGELSSLVEGFVAFEQDF